MTAETLALSGILLCEFLLVAWPSCSPRNTSCHHKRSISSMPGQEEKVCLSDMGPGSAPVLSPYIDHAMVGYAAWSWPEVGQLV